MSKELETILKKLKQQFEKNYQGQLEKIILFGSQARQQGDSNSDIDLAIVIKGAVNPVQEIKRNNPWITDFCLETDALINCLYLSAEQYQTQETSLIRNIKTEGILV